MKQQCLTKLFFNAIETLKIKNVISFIIADIPKKPENMIENVRNRNQKNKSKIQIEYQKILRKKKIRIKKEICILGNTNIHRELSLTNTFLYLIEGNNKKIDIQNFI